MSVASQSIDFCIDILATQVTEEIAKESGISEKEAIRRFIDTRTYNLLVDKESRLYLESFEYVMDMLKAEENGNWDEWLEV